MNMNGNRKRSLQRWKPGSSVFSAGLNAVRMLTDFNLLLLTREVLRGPAPSHLEEHLSLWLSGPLLWNQLQSRCRRMTPSLLEDEEENFPLTSNLSWHFSVIICCMNVFRTFFITVYFK